MSLQTKILQEGKDGAAIAMGQGPRECYQVGVTKKEVQEANLAFPKLSKTANPAPQAHGQYLLLVRGAPGQCGTHAGGGVCAPMGARGLRVNYGAVPSSRYQ